MSIQSIGDRHEPYWKRAQFDWKFWLALIVVIAAIAAYALSGDSPAK